MNAITQMITQQLGGTAARTIAQRFGISETTANRAVQIGIPLILAALARNASQPQEAESLHQSVAKDHDGSIFDNLTGYLQHPQSANGGRNWTRLRKINSRLLKVIWPRQLEWTKARPRGCSRP